MKTDNTPKTNKMSPVSSLVVIILTAIVFIAIIAGVYFILENFAMFLILLWYVGGPIFLLACLIYAIREGTKIYRT